MRIYKFTNGLLLLWNHGLASPNNFVTFLQSYSFQLIVVAVETNQNGATYNLNEQI